MQTRFDLEKTHEEYNGIREEFPISNATHSLFGCSKAAGDLYVQEYGRYFGLKTALFRPGCLTGPTHKGTKLHGFLNYLVKCAKYDIPYQIIGYDGKQVRDNIHAKDFAKALILTTTKDQYGTVYNFGGGRHSNHSMLECILYLEEKLGRSVKTTYEPKPRIGDHKWYIGSCEKFLADYPDYKYEYGPWNLIDEILDLV
jgi:CDP-paratose 2-epimerase